MPCDTLLGRVYREREEQALTVYPLARVRSLATQPQSREKRQLGAGVVLEQGADTSADFSGSPYGFWLSLSILLHAYVIVGVDGWCPLQVAQDYLELVEARIWHKSSPGLATVKAVELQHRTRWVDLVRGDQSMSLGDAIKTTSIELIGSWQLGTFSPGTGWGLRDSPSGSGGSRSRKRGRADGQARAETAGRSLLVEKRGDKEICKNFNSGRCTSETCPRDFLHICNVKGCGKKHPRCEHHGRT